MMLDIPCSIICPKVVDVVTDKGYVAVVRTAAHTSPVEGAHTRGVVLARWRCRWQLAGASYAPGCVTSRVYEDVARDSERCLPLEKRSPSAQVASSARRPVGGASGGEEGGGEYPNPGIAGGASKDTSRIVVSPRNEWFTTLRM